MFNVLFCTLKPRNNKVLRMLNDKKITVIEAKKKLAQNAENKINIDVIRSPIKVLKSLNTITRVTAKIR